MNKQTEQARELLAKQRKAEELRQETMRSRGEAELLQSDGSEIDAEARKAIAHERAEIEKAQATLLERSEEELRD